MPTNTYVALATQTLGSAAASVTFSSIPATYTDLVLITSVQNNSGGNRAMQIILNADTATNYSGTEVPAGVSGYLGYDLKDAYGTALIYLNGSTDYVELYVFQGAASQNLSASSAYTYFQAAMIRSA
jgi:hypothetical protein